MSSSAHRIDFSNLGGPVYAGRPRGELARKKLKIDALDGDASTVDVVIPQDTYSLNSSFFLGFFGPSVVKLGTRDAFLSKYHFIAPPYIMEEVEKGVQRALIEVSPL